MSNEEATFANNDCDAMLITIFVVPAYAFIHFLAIHHLLHNGFLDAPIGYMFLLAIPFAGLRLYRNGGDIKQGDKSLRRSLKFAIWANTGMHCVGWLQLAYYAWQPANGLSRSTSVSYLLMLYMAVPALIMYGELNLALKRTFDPETTSTAKS